MGVAADCGEVEVRDAYLEDAERLLLETGVCMPFVFYRPEQPAQQRLHRGC